jgi:hypothetical protein
VPGAVAAPGPGEAMSFPLSGLPFSAPGLPVKGRLTSTRNSQSIRLKTPADHETRLRRPRPQVPASPVEATDWTKNRWAMKKMISIGTRLITLPAISRVQSVECAP